MSSELDQLIQFGQDTTLFKYYALATCTILFYDYLLTLSDEVKYAWSGKNSLAFWLFVLNRYFPMTYQFWQIAMSYAPPSSFTTKVCEKTAFYHLFTAIICTFLEQAVLTLRIYAVAMKNVPIAAGLGVIIVAQIVIGTYMMALAIKEGVETIPPIPYDAYHLCLFVPHRNLELAFICISLFYDFCAFLLTVFFVVRARTARFKFPTIWGVLLEDATRYFLVIFTSHFVLVMFLNLGRPSIQLLPATGTVVYLPVMISRIMLSLKRAADPIERDWCLGDRAANEIVGLRSIRFFYPRGGTDVREEGSDNIPLDTYFDSRAGG